MLLNFQNVEDVKKVLNNLTSQEKLELASNIFMGRNQSDFIDSKGNFFEELDEEADINNFYEENKTEENIENLLYQNFQEKIDDFKSKYAYTHTALIDKTTKEIINIDLECSKKLELIVNDLTNCIKNLISV